MVKGGEGNSRPTQTLIAHSDNKGRMLQASTSSVRGPKGPKAAETGRVPVEGNDGVSQEVGGH